MRKVGIWTKKCIGNKGESSYLSDYKLAGDAKSRYYSLHLALI